jgi:hypothetical protein
MQTFRLMLNTLDRFLPPLISTKSQFASSPFNGSGAYRFDSLLLEAIASAFAPSNLFLLEDFSMTNVIFRR